MRAALIQFDEKAPVSCVYVISDTGEQQRIVEAGRGMDAVLLHGRLSKGSRAHVMEGIIQGRDRVIIATASLAGEGLDIPRLDVLVLASPVKFSGRLLQYIGRVLRRRQAKGDRKFTTMWMQN